MQGQKSDKIPDQSGSVGAGPANMTPRRQLGVAVAAELSAEFNKLALNIATVNEQTSIQRVHAFCGSLRESGMFMNMSKSAVADVIAVILRDQRWLSLFIDKHDLLLQPKPVFALNESGELIQTYEHEPTVVSHIGRKSINAAGVFTKDAIWVDTKSADTTQLLGFLYTMLNKYPDAVVYDDVNDRMTVRSRMLTGGAPFSLQQVFEPDAHFSTCLVEDVTLVPQRIIWGQANIIDRFRPVDYAKYMRNNAINNQLVDIFYSTVLQAPVAHKAMLQRVVSQKISTGNPICNNRGLYFKMFCNAIARARIAVADRNPRLPQIVNENTGFEFCDVNSPQFNEANLNRWADEGYFSFFERRESSDDALTFMEIMGYNGMYFRSLPGDPVMPFNRLRLPPINVLYFSTEEHEHQARDMPAAVLWSMTFAYASERNEDADCMYGLQMGIEVMCGNSFRTQRRHNRHRRQPLNLRWTGRRDNQGDVMENIIFPVTQNPDHDDYDGDFHNDQADMYTAPHWYHVMLDAYQQQVFSPIPQPVAENWVYNMLGMKKSPTTTTATNENIRHLDASQIIRLATLGFAIVATASTTVFMSYCITGAIVDAYLRDLQVPQPFANLMRSIMETLDRTTIVQAPFFLFVQNIVGEMLGFTYSFHNMQRTWNAGERYTVEVCNDNYGVYHYNTGNQVMSYGMVFAIDDFIVSRPREWGLTTPNPTGDLQNAVVHDYGFAATVRIITHSGSTDWATRHPYPILMSSRVSYCLLFLNAVAQAFCRNQFLNTAIEYYGSPASNMPVLPNWQLYGAMVPQPIWVPGLNIVDPGTIISFDWRRAIMLAPAFRVVGPALHTIEACAFQATTTFTSAGCVLRRATRALTDVIGQRPTQLLMPWQIQNTPSAVPLTDYVFTRPAAQNLTPSTGRGDTSLAATSVDVAATGDVIVQVQNMTKADPRQGPEQGASHPNDDAPGKSAPAKNTKTPYTKPAAKPKATQPSAIVPAAADVDAVAAAAAVDPTIPRARKQTTILQLTSLY